MDYSVAIDKIQNAKRILLTTHTRPDGDAIGSLVGLKSAIVNDAKADSRECSVHILLLSNLADNYRFMLDGNEWFWGSDLDEQSLADGKLDNFDLIVVCDTRAAKQLPGIAKYLSSRNDSVIVIDHHIGGDDIGSCQIVVTDACAAGEIVYNLIRSASWPIDATSAEALFVAISTDTGWFRFENTTLRAMTAAGELIAAGARPDLLYQKLFQNSPPERLKLIARAIDSIQLHYDNRLATMQISNQDLTDTSAHRTHIENVVNTCQEIGSLWAWVLFVEQKDRTTRCSFRSRSNIDVNKVASQLGGGGHARAAGASLEMPLEDAKKHVLEIVMPLFSK